MEHLVGLVLAERGFEVLPTHDKLFANLIQVGGLGDIHGSPAWVLELQVSPPDAAFLSAV